jgi:hypothetical protein
MNSDCHFWIGSTHDVCQDYAAAGARESAAGEFPFAVVSDGCSSSPKTDWGARILVDAAEKWLAKYAIVSPMETLAYDIMLPAREKAKAIGLPNHALDATLLIATHELVRCFGDGVVAMLRKDGSMDVTSIVYPSGAPLYLNYLHDAERLKGYIEEFGAKRIVASAMVSPDGIEQVDHLVQELRDLKASDFGIEIYVPRDTVAVAVMSDGISSYMEDASSETSKTEREVPVIDVITRLLSFKGYNGVFVNRRAKRFIKDCREWKWQNTDDVSIGVVHLETR